MTDREQLCKEFTLLTGGHWHEWELGIPPDTFLYQCKCGEIETDYNQNLSYENPADVLRVIEKFDWSELFMAKLVYGFEQPNIEGKDWDGCIPVGYILEPDALLKAAVAFLKEGKK